MNEASASIPRLKCRESLVKNDQQDCNWHIHISNDVSCTPFPNISNASSLPSLGPIFSLYSPTPLSPSTHIPPSRFTFRSCLSLLLAPPICQSPSLTCIHLRFFPTPTLFQPSPFSVSQLIFSFNSVPHNNDREMHKIHDGCVNLLRKHNKGNYEQQRKYKCKKYIGWSEI